MIEVIIIERPDIDKIEKEGKEFYSKFANLEFKECPTCAAKPGSPLLRNSCYHNRKVITKLREKRKMRIWR